MTDVSYLDGVDPGFREAASDAVQAADDLWALCRGEARSWPLAARRRLPKRANQLMGLAGLLVVLGLTAASSERRPTLARGVQRIRDMKTTRLSDAEALVKLAALAKVNPDIAYVIHYLGLEHARKLYAVEIGEVAK